MYPTFQINCSLIPGLFLLFMQRDHSRMLVEWATAHWVKNRLITVAGPWPSGGWSCSPPVTMSSPTQLTGFICGNGDRCNTMLSVNLGILGVLQPSVVYLRGPRGCGVMSLSSCRPLLPVVSCCPPVISLILRPSYTTSKFVLVSKSTTVHAESKVSWLNRFLEFSVLLFCLQRGIAAEWTVAVIQLNTGKHSCPGVLRDSVRKDG